MSAADQSTESIQSRILELGDWFHNLNLAGIQTAPNHFLGDYPACKWQHLQAGLPADLSGKTVLDIGCNGGFYSFEMKRRGADRVVGIDSDLRYLEQARFASSVNGLNVEFVQTSVYDVAGLGEKFDVVLFMGVLYHLRYPLLALDLLFEHSVKEMLVVQSLVRGSKRVTPTEENYPFENMDVFRRDGFPCMYFIEHRYSNDPSNWWIPNRACVEALIRSAGFDIVGHPEEEAYICTPRRSL